VSMGESRVDGGAERGGGGDGDEDFRERGHW
jgi:hypothetical protein